MAAGRSGLLHATTGSGKTYAVWIGALCALPRSACREGRSAPPLAGAVDHADARARGRHRRARCELPLPELAPGMDRRPAHRRHASAERARQDQRLPTALVTTPESR